VTPGGVLRRTGDGARELADVTWRGRRSAGSSAGYRTPVFFFFSNRLGCLGSLVLSAVATLILLLLFDVL
jgi:hypothetical protein